MKQITVYSYSFILEELTNMKSCTKLRYVKKLYKKINKLFDTEIDSIPDDKFDCFIKNIINCIQNFNTTIKILNKVFNYNNNEIMIYQKNINKLFNQLFLTFEALRDSKTSQ